MLFWHWAARLFGPWAKCRDQDGNAAGRRSGGGSAILLRASFSTKLERTFSRPAIGLSCSSMNFSIAPMILACSPNSKCASRY